MRIFKFSIIINIMLIMTIFTLVYGFETIEINPEIQ